MDLLVWGIIFILGWLLLRNVREGASSQEYDSDTCLTKASQNEQNIKDLQAQVKQLLALQDQMTSIKNQNDANTQTLSQLTTQVMSTS
jgi:hypothetical protein